MTRPLTKLEEGIWVEISPSELEKLKKERTGFLDCECYPDQYKEIMEPGEIGRFLIFRFKLLDE